MVDGSRQELCCYNMKKEEKDMDGMCPGCPDDRTLEERLNDACKEGCFDAKPDNVNHPAHYISNNGIETIDVIEAFTEELKGMEAFCTANVIKYISRWKKKNGVEDLKKARWYLNYLIDILDGERNE